MGGRWRRRGGSRRRGQGEKASFPEQNQECCWLWCECTSCARRISVRPALGMPECAGRGQRRGKGGAGSQDSHFSILTATFMVACEWLRP